PPGRREAGGRRARLRRTPPRPAAGEPRPGGRRLVAFRRGGRDRGARGDGEAQPPAERTQAAPADRGAGGRHTPSPVDLVMAEARPSVRESTIAGLGTVAALAVTAWLIALTEHDW